MPISLVSWNVGHLGFTQTLKAHFSSSLPSLLSRLNADILCLQETKLTTRNPLPVTLAPGFTSLVSSNRRGSPYAGVAIFIRDALNLPIIAVEEGMTGALFTVQGSWEGVRGGPDPLLPLADPALSHAGYTFTQLDLDSDGRCLLVDLGIFVLVCCYCPAGGDSPQRLAFKAVYLAALERRLRRLAAAGVSVVLMGDVNVSRQKVDTSYDLTESGSVGRAWLNGLLEGEGGEGGSQPLLVDAFRHFHPGAVVYTCWDAMTRAREGNFGSRIDLVLVSPKLVAAGGGGGARVLASSVETEVLGSDHCPITVTVELPARSEAAAAAAAAAAGAGAQQQQRYHPFSANAQIAKLGRQLGLQEAFASQAAAAPRGAAAPAASAAAAAAAAAPPPPPPGPAPSLRKRPSDDAALLKGKHQKLDSFFRLAERGEVVDLCDEDAAEQAAAPCSSSSVGIGEGGGGSGSGSGSGSGAAAASWGLMLRGPQPPPRCLCDKPAVERKVIKKGTNFGRSFYGCSGGKGSSCTFFTFK